MSRPPLDTHFTYSISFAILSLDKDLSNSDSNFSQASDQGWSNLSFNKVNKESWAS